MKQGLGKVTTFAAAMFFALGVTSLAFAASQFEGTWKTKDTKGNPFEIVLSADGTATGDRSGEGLNGKWKEEGDSAVIEWGDAWTTKIAKMGDQYKKTAFEKGKSMGETEAQKVK
jgi:hypothetical protein